MVKKLIYIFYKIVSNFYLIIIRNKQIFPGLYLLKKPHIINRIVFYLNDKSFFHLGDQLFFAQTIIALKNNNFPIEVLAPDNLKLFWRANGIKINSLGSKLDKKSDLVITYPPVYIKHKLHSYNSLIVDFTNSKINSRITDYFSEKLSHIIFSKPLQRPKIKFDLNINKKIKNQIINIGENIWVFNNQIDSGFFRKSFKKNQKLYNKMMYLFNKGEKIIFVGKSSNNNIYEKYFSLDLRGKTTPDEIFSLLSLNCVKGVISYDNFLMHACLLLNKKAHIVFRGRYSRKKELHHYNNVNTAFSYPSRKNIWYI
ncbi:MAG: hypothetical protein CMG74_13240 [Candidatus Marinimicrobia bacterium]|nr:hypothetical protein [Candidatus Neomarinimicrobiota bacterium]|tara:strand:+ start:76229 stop:77164 length:936 start_codon:yes stop_codon:yes gene_type:complete